MKDIYEERRPERLDKDTPKKEYPTELILNIDSIESPSVGKMAVSIRKYILECLESGIAGTVVFNFMIDLINPVAYDQINIISEQKFVTLAEYIEDMKRQFPDMNFVFTVRGFFLGSMAPLLFIDIPYRVSPLTMLISQDEPGKALSKFLEMRQIENFDNKLLQSLIYRSNSYKKYL